jgi:predicted DNA-binding transcriptional regulator AlpA
MTQQNPSTHAARRPANKPRKTPPSRRAPMTPVVVSDSGDGDEPARPVMIFKPEVIKRVGFTFPTLWKWMRDGKFPLSFDIGSKTAWREDEIDAWLASRPRSQLLKSEG